MTAITRAASLTLLCLSATDCHRIEVFVSFHFIVNQASGWFTILTGQSVSASSSSLCMSTQSPVTKRHQFIKSLRYH
ncbi:hypothetical protein FOXYSP1_19635 [Fusarium oxysporum f. sp. phaseoli]